VRDDVAARAVRHLPPEYTVVDNDGAHSKGNPVEIGSGGSSVVYRAIYRGRLNRAVKLIIPRNDLVDSLGIQLFEKNFDNEIVALAELNHENIVKLTDFGRIECEGLSYPFVAMEYVGGCPLDDYCFNSSTTGEQIVCALEQVLDGLSYLHANDVLHSDVKPTNILVRSGDPLVRPSVVLVDLGISHKVPKEDDLDVLSEQTYFFSTQRYTLSALQATLAQGGRYHLFRSEVRRSFPWQDLHSVGVILGDLLNDVDIKKRLEEYIGKPNMAAFQDIRARLNNPQVNSRGYRSARAARAAVERLPFRRIAPLGIGELAPVQEKGVVLPTSRARVPVSTRVDSVISHPLFQRLHNLPQLDLLHYVHPGATQSRFVHALHTYELARTAIGQQLGNWQFRLNVDIQDIVDTLLVALLDSVGRYHFQHMFEDFLPDRRQDGLRAAGLLHDAELLDTFLSSPKNDGFDEVRLLKDAHGAALADVVGEWTEMDWADVRKRQADPDSPIRGFLSGLLSNPVDVDKLAYLIDDSAFTGLPFGQAVAPGPVFEALRVPDERDWASLAVPRVAVAVREKALSYVEQSVLSRYWNIQTGYWYRTNRSLQAMVKYQIGCLLKAKALHFDKFVAGTLHLSVDGALRWLADAFQRSIRNNEIPDNSVNPIEGLLDSRREIYRRLVTVSPVSKLDARAQDRHIYEGLNRRSALEDNLVCEDTASVLEAVKPGLNVRPGEILLDLPRVRRREEIGGKILVYADSPGATFLGELSNISPVLAGLQEQFDRYAKRLRIFVHPRIYRALDGVEEKAHKAVLEMLRSEFGETL
jgi:HD superfamily phosphohydrolase/tRNA A-37 threonylcarbamoyl transferase component Bud32